MKKKDVLSKINKKIPASIRPKKETIEAFQTQFDKAVSDFYSLIRSPRFSLTSFEDLSLSPSVDLVEDEKSFKVECEMPGLDENDITVEVKDGKLWIKGEKETSFKDKNKNYVLREIGYGSYERSILLPKNLDLDKATASFKKGMLWVAIPKIGQSLPSARKLKIEKCSGLESGSKIRDIPLHRGKDKE